MTHNTSSESSRSDIFRDPYSINDIIYRPFEKLREREIRGQAVVFPRTNHFLF